MARSVLILLLCVQLVISVIDAKNTLNSLPGIELKRVGREELEGCWKDDHEIVAALCFHISSKFMRITNSLNGDEPLALYYTNTIRDIHYVQVLGIGILR